MDCVRRAKNSVRFVPLHSNKKHFSAVNSTLKICVVASENTGVLVGSA